MTNRPRTRLDCAGGERPCSRLSCRHHLALDVRETGTITSPLIAWSLSERDSDEAAERWIDAVTDALAFMPDTCSLDVADRGEHTLHEVGEVLRMTRERARQVEAMGLRKAKRPMKKDGWDEHEPGDTAGPAELMKRSGGAG